MNESNNTKLDFAYSLSSGIAVNLNDCYAWGMAYGCSVDCPVLKNGNCPVQEENVNLK